MSSEQLSHRDNTKKEREIQVEKEKVPQLTSHFEAIAVRGSKPTEERHQQHVSIAKGSLPGREEDDRRRIAAAAASGKPDDTHELAAQFESLADRVSGKKESDKERTAAAREVGSEQAKGKEGKNQPSLEEVSNYRAQAQEQSDQAIMAAKERLDKANRESQEKTNKANERYDRENKEFLVQGGRLGARTDETKHRGKEDAEEGTFERRGGQQQTGLGTVKETLTTAAITAKDYTAPIAEKAKDYTVSAGQTTAHYLGEKAVAAKDAAIESGKVAAEYAGKAAEDLKEKAVVAGWSTAHYSCDTAVEGTKAAARLVKGAAGYAGDIAVKPLAAAKNVAESTGESVREYTARKKEEAQRGGSTYKQSEKESMYEKTKETFEGAKEEVKGRGEGEVEEEKGDDGGIFGAIGETIYEIAQTTKEIVIGPGDESGKQRKTLGFEIGQDKEEEEKGQGYEKEHYQTPTRKEHRA